MSPLEIALVILVGIWSIIFIIIAIAAIMMVREVKRAMDRVNEILETFDQTVNNVAGPIQTISAALMGMVAKSGIDTVKNFINKKSRK